MAKFGDLDRYFDPGLTLADVPGRDGQQREYVIPLPSAELGLWCQRTAQAAGQIEAASTDEEVQAAVDRVKALEPEGDLTLAERTLGAAYPQMVTDGVSHTHIQFCGAVAYVWIIGGEEAAERYWKSGGDPESVARGNRAERRAAARTGQTSTAGATATPTPGSTSGTTSPTTSRGNGQARRKRSRGGRS